MTKGTRLIMRVGYNNESARQAIRYLTCWMTDQAGGCTMQEGTGTWLDADDLLIEEVSMTLVATLPYHPMPEPMLADMYSIIDTYKELSGEDAVLVELDTINCVML